MYIDNYDIKILGFTGIVESVEELLSDIGTDDSSVVQLLNADMVGGKNHILHGINQAILAFDREENFAKDLGVEICLRCSAQKQISKAFSILGLKKGKMNICAVLLNADNEIIDYLNDKFVRNDDVLLPDESILMDVFDISQEEGNAYLYEEVIIDKISKLAVDY